MKYTLLVTQQCNLQCLYCYIGKKPESMSLPTASRIIDYIFQRSPKDECIHIGFFGGEPLLAFDAIRSMTDIVENHPGYDRERVDLAIITNGTIFSDDIAHFVNDHGLSFGISCDGPPHVHDVSRCYPDGRGSSRIVAQTIAKAAAAIDNIMVNAVYGPQTLRALPLTVEYLSSLGVRQIHINPDFSATWSSVDLALLPQVYAAVAACYIQSIRDHNPLFINLIDSKIAVILRGGYQAKERCRMGKAELSFTPDGGIYPCERLVGAGTENGRIGHIDHGIKIEELACHMAPGETKNAQCASCDLQAYCMHWCGCSNFFATGFYNRVNSFICASEKAAMNAAIYTLDSLGPAGFALFSEHASGHTKFRRQSSVTATPPKNLEIVSQER